MNTEVDVYSCFMCENHGKLYFIFHSPILDFIFIFQIAIVELNLND